MKIFFKVLIANVATAYVTIENQKFYIKEIMQLSSSLQITKDATHYCYTISMPVLFQGAGDDTAGAATVITLNNSNEVVYYDFRRVTLYKFAGGTITLVPYAISPCTKVTPRSCSILTDNIAEAYSSTHWPYMAATDEDLIGQNSVASCIVLQVDTGAVKKNAALSAGKSAIQTSQFMLTA